MYVNIKSWLARKLIKLLGWKVDTHYPPDIRRGVLVCAPHTSNWDALYTFLGINAANLPYRFAIKKEAFFFPVGTLLRSLGAVAVDRGASTREPARRGHAIQQMAALLQQSQDMFVAIAPEGTRKRVIRWRSGFFYIAQQAQVPIIAVYVDYAKKEMGVGPIYYPPHKDPDKIIAALQAFYSTKTGKYPEAGRGVAAGHASPSSIPKSSSAKVF